MEATRSGSVPTISTCDSISLVRMGSSTLLKLLKHGGMFGGVSNPDIADDQKKVTTEPDATHKRYPHGTEDKDGSPAGKLVDELLVDPDLVRVEFEDEEGKDSDRFTKPTYTHHCAQSPYSRRSCEVSTQFSILRSKKSIYA